MENSNVVQFNKDDEFYFNLGKSCLQEGNFVKAIKHLQKAIELVKNKNEFLLSSYCLVLAQAYTLVNNYDLSNFYYFWCLNCELFSQIAYRGLGENFVLLGDDVAARYYLNQCINTMEGSQVANSAQKRLDMLIQKNSNKFRVIKPEDNILDEGKLDQAENYMSKGKFEQAIELFEQIGNFEDSKIRSELSLAYFFVNDTQKGIDLIKDYGGETVLDLCNLLLIYHCEGNNEKFEEIKNKLRNIEAKNNEEYFKIGLTFAQTEEVDLGKLYMQKFFEKSKFELELEFLYCLTCINAGDYDTAKEKLIDLKSVNPFDSYIFDYYLNLCDKKADKKVEYLFNVPVSEFLKVQAKIKEYLVCEDKFLEEEFLNNKNFFYFISKLPDSNTKSLLFLKLAKIENKEITEFFRYVLIQNSAKTKLKHKIVLARLNLNSINNIAFTRDNFYVKISLPYKMATKILNENINKASINCVEYLLYHTNMLDINLKRNVIMLERKISNDNVDENILSVFLTWQTVSKHKASTLTNICNYFNVMQKDFYAFVEKYNLEV